MEEDILNYSPTVMFRGTPCSIYLTFFYNFGNNFYFLFILCIRHCVILRFYSSSLTINILFNFIFLSNFFRKTSELPNQLTIILFATCSGFERINSCLILLFVIYTVSFLLSQFPFFYHSFLSFITVFLNFFASYVVFSDLDITK